MEIPYSALTEDTLVAIIEDFVSREATDYGHGEVSMEQKVRQVRKQLEQGLVTIVYSVEEDAPYIISRAEFLSRSKLKEAE
ncbi:MAG: YheU family protein [Bdellovibrionales bacterium]|nr:YheU family protein [Bdellovibrionales bacterium]